MYADVDDSVPSTAYGDELLEGVDLAAHSATGGISTRTEKIAWLIIVGALIFLWLMGAIAFRNHRQ